LETINEHCAQLKHQIEMKAESLIDEINKLSKEMKCDIDKYEKNCIDSFEKSVDIKKTVKSKISKGSSFYETSSKYLTNLKIDDEEISDLMKKANKFHEDFRQLKKDLSDAMFTKTRLKFEENEKKLDTSMLGRLKFYFPIDLDSPFLSQNQQKEIESINNINSNATASATPGAFAIGATKPMPVLPNPVATSASSSPSSVSSSPNINKFANSGLKSANFVGTRILIASVKSPPFSIISDQTTSNNKSSNSTNSTNTSNPIRTTAPGSTNSAIKSSSPQIMTQSPAALHTDTSHTFLKTSTVIPSTTTAKPSSGPFSPYLSAASSSSTSLSTNITPTNIHSQSSGTSSPPFSFGSAK
jgi:hypothetical protein